MPCFRSFFRVRFVWHMRAVALRCCQCWITLAVCSISTVEARPRSHQLFTSAPTAACTWHTVSCSFFPPQLFVNSCKEQIAHRSEDQVPLEPKPATSLPLVNEAQSKNQSRTEKRQLRNSSGAIARSIHGRSQNALDQDAGDVISKLPRAPHVVDR